jgi:hypothetical protein
VMAAIKPLLAGKADMGKISGLIKTRLGWLNLSCKIIGAKAPFLFCKLS